MLEQRSRTHSILTSGRRRRGGHGLGSLGMLAAALAVGMTPVGLADPGPAAAAPVPYLSHFPTVTDVASTVPANGDVNPYGVATVPFSTGSLVRGDT